MAKFIYVMSGLFVIALAIVIGTRLSTDAMAVIIGIICGMLTTVPTMILLMFLIRQKDKQQIQQQYPGPSYPPVVVVNGQQHPYHYGVSTSTPNSQGYLPPTESGRSFKVVGQEAPPTESGGNKFSLNSIWDDDL